MSDFNPISAIFNKIYFFITQIFTGTYTERIAANTWILIRELWYYAFLAAFAAVLISQFISHKKVRALLSRKSHLTVLFAAAIGVLSPMCTFAAIPIVGGLIAAGVALPPLMAFLIASPLMNPSLFVMTWGVIGPHMAIARTFSALLLGFGGGMIVKTLLEKRWIDFSMPLREGFKHSKGMPVCVLEMKGESGWFIAKTLLKHTWRMTYFVSKYFFIGLLIAGTVQALVSPVLIATLLGGENFMSIFLGGLLGLPLYVCGGGTVATIGVLISLGMGQGAALAFFITGPATKISTLLTLNAVVKKRVAAFYLCITIIGGILLGYGYSRIAPDLDINPGLYGDIESLDNTIFFLPVDDE